MRIMIGVNTLTSVNQAVYSNHIQFFFRLGREFPKEDTFIINTPNRMSIDRMRNMTAKIALEYECDYILFIDDDVVIPIDSLKKLIAADMDIAAGWTIIRGYPFKNMFFRYTDDTQKALENYPDSDLPETAGIVPVDAVGFSCCLIKCSLLKKIAPPYFVTGPNNTEDIYFCVKAKHYFPETTIVVDTSIKTSHALGTEYIDPFNKKEYASYYEAAFPELAHPVVPPVDRGQEYVEVNFHE